MTCPEPCECQDCNVEGTDIIFQDIEVDACIVDSIEQFSGRDDAAGPGDARPNSDAAQSDFAAAVASNGGTLEATIDFEDQTSLPICPLTAHTIATGVTVTSNSICTDGDAGITDNTGNPAILGYNTTSGGSIFIRNVPPFTPRPFNADVTFNFTTPVMAFGCYITGLGTVASDLFIIFDNGEAQELTEQGGVNGGVQFFGFISPQTAISEITFRLVIPDLSPSSQVRDVVGYDDIQYAHSLVSDCCCPESECPEGTPVEISLRDGRTAEVSGTEIGIAVFGTSGVGIGSCITSLEGCCSSGCECEEASFAFTDDNWEQEVLKIPRYQSPPIPPVQVKGNKIMLSQAFRRKLAIRRHQLSQA